MSTQTTVRRMATEVVAVVLAAGRSSRLGQPKQLLPYRDTTLLGATLRAACAHPFDQVIVTLGAAANEVRATVPFDGIEVVLAEDAGSGCSSSLRAAMTAVHPLAEGVVLFLGDQPEVAPSAIAAVIEAGRRGCGMAVCEYRDGIGHPFWLGRSVFDSLQHLHGDKGVWKLVDAMRTSGGLCEVAVEGDIPLDVDTWADYERLLSAVSL